MSFRRRTFPEMLENLLTAVRGGVAAEPHAFPPQGQAAAPYRMTLQASAVQDVISVYGSRDGAPHQFRKGTDYRLVEGRVLEWPEEAELPDPGSLVDVNYAPAGAIPPVTDLHVGSVVRTLAESIGLEMARLSAQLEAVYESGFITTAEGASLDNVVALLGVERVRAGRAAGELELSRARGTPGTISIPAGTRVITPDGKIEYATTATATMAEGQDVVRVPARDLEPNDPVPADSLTVLPRPIAGVAGVRNPSPTAFAGQDESDAELRLRAQSFLHGSERATLGALRQAIAQQGITAEIEEPEPGKVTVTAHAETITPEMTQRLLTAIDQVRPAGVVVTQDFGAAPERLDLELRLTTVDGLLEADLRGVQRAVREATVEYFARLPVAQPASLSQVTGLALRVPQVVDARLLSARLAGSGADVLDRERGELLLAGVPAVLGELRIADPNLPTALRVVVAHPAGAAPPDPPTLSAALSEAVAHLSAQSAAELSPAASERERGRREISFGKLLRATPLPTKPAESLAAYDATPEAAPLPALPTEAPPYVVTNLLTAEGGRSVILSGPADAPYRLSTSERLVLAGVEIQALPAP